MTDPNRVVTRTRRFEVLLLVSAAVLLAACSSGGDDAASVTTAQSLPTTVAPITTEGPSTAVVETAAPETAPSTESAAAPSEPPPDPAALLASGLDRFAAGYHFVTTATINGAVAIAAEGDQVDDGTRLSVTSGGSTVDYVVTPDGTWVFSDGTWSDLDEPAPVSDPLGPLQAPLTVEIQAFGDGPTTVVATYPASALALVGDEPVEVVFTFEGDVLRSMAYVAPSAELSADVRADFSDLTDATPVTIPTL